MIKKPKTYVKVFKVTNKDGTFTEEDFNLFKEKFEVIRDLYYDERVGYDYFHNFREIIKEVKRAANNAGLTAKLLRITYDSNYCVFSEGVDIEGVRHEFPKRTESQITLSHDSEFSYNLIVSFKRVKLFQSQKDFVIRCIKGHATDITVDEKQGILYILPETEEIKEVKYTWRG